MRRVIVYGGDSVQIEILSTGCTGTASVLSTEGTLTDTISTNACNDVGLIHTTGQAQHVDGILFVNDHPQYGATSADSVAGIHPTYTVIVEDGFHDTETGHDWDDVVLSVNVLECELYADSVPSDSVAGDTGIMRKLRHVWDESEYWKDWWERLERGGWIYEYQGENWFAEVSVGASPCGIADIKNFNELPPLQGLTPRAMVHSHPLPAGTYTNPATGGCSKAAAGETFGVPNTGPSQEDLESFKGSPYDGFIIGPDLVWHLDLDTSSMPFTFVVRSYPRNPDCVMT